MTAAPVTIRDRLPKNLVEPVEPIEIELGDDVQWGVYEITPHVARYWLTLNTQNPRNINPRTVMDYARDITADAWPLNFQPITFRKNGSLDNGQHRLEAIVAANKPIISLVVWGVDDDVYDTVDIGLKRSAAQIVSVENPRYAAFMSAAAALIWKLEQPNPQRALHDTRLGPTMHERLDILRQHPELYDSVEHILSRCRNVTRIAASTSVSHIIHYYGTKTRGRTAADRFFFYLNTGIAPEGEPPLTANHPAYRLRETLTRLKAEQRKVRQPYAYGLWLVAWNAFATGEMLRRLTPLDYETNPDLTIL
jgi:hypothetical protein